MPRKAYPMLNHDPTVAEAYRMMRVSDGIWGVGPQGGSRVIIWENFDTDAIIEDFFSSILEASN